MRIEPDYFTKIAAWVRSHGFDAREERDEHGAQHVRIRIPYTSPSGRGYVIERAYNAHEARAVLGY